MYVLQYVLMDVCLPGERLEYERSTCNHKGTSNLPKKISTFKKITQAF
jgi:hypothetical protein